MKHRLWACVVFLLASGAGGIAFACLVGAPAHKVDPGKIGVDVVAPPRPDVEVVSVVRGQGPRIHADGTATSVSTDDLGMVRLKVAELIDDDSLPSEMGLRIVVPDSLSELGRQLGPSGDVRPSFSKSDETWEIWLAWVDGSEDKQEPISLQVLVYAIDAAGNVSAMADTLALVDPGR